MDRESELVKSENWTELRRFYAARSGHAWELAWIHLLKMRDRLKAIEYFNKTLEDPRYEEASSIVLWKLGQRPARRAYVGPPSLRLYEAYMKGDAPTLLRYLRHSSENATFVPAILRQICDSLTREDIVSWVGADLPASLCFQLGAHAERKLKDLALADEFYKRFYQDAWSIRLADENSRLVFDPEISRRLRHAYSKRDGITVKRTLKTASFRLEKLTEKAASPLWIEALQEAFELEAIHLTENLFGYPFWKHHDLSPIATQEMRKRLFSEEEIPEPEFISGWRDFFEAEGVESFPANLDLDSLPLWQIRVELNPETLSDALLKFPTEERFLFLWSLRHRENQKDSNLARKWPENLEESEVVRKNLERAFDRSSNKVLWFDRVRQVGCSQSFYEYAASHTSIPLSWILEDLKAGFIKASPAIRAALRDQLSVTISQGSEPADLSSKSLAEALSYLTPAETQTVLLSRFVLAPLPEDILNDDYLDLLWDAQGRVSLETSRRWTKEVLHFLSTRRLRDLQSRHWRWIETAWEYDSKELERFSPQLDSGLEYPWELYLEKLSQANQTGMILTCLHRIPDERLKEKWIRAMVEEKHLDHRVFAAINSLATDYVRHQLLAAWYECKEEWSKAIDHHHEELHQTPIVNEQLKIAKQVLHLHRRSGLSNSEAQVAQILSLAKFLETNGSLDADLCDELATALESHKEFLLAWKFTVQRWIRSSDTLRESILPRLLDLGFRGRAVEETQRFLVDHLFKLHSPSVLAYSILDSLLNENSFVRLKHLRPELIEKASQLYPLHRNLLQVRAREDYRAVLLWDAFYGDELREMASPPSFKGKRNYELWTLTDTASQSDAFSPFVRYLEHLPADKKTSETHEFLEKAERSAVRLSKQFSSKRSMKVILSKDLQTPIKIVLPQPTIVLRLDFFEMLDEEMWSALVTGALQLWEDRDRGLFDEKRLLERFFQGMLLSGASLQKNLRLWVWLAMSEGLLEEQVLRANPEQLIEKLPFLNALVIFYLSRDFSDKLQKNCLVPA